MFDRGMFQTSDLVQPLRAREVALSREQVYRLVAGTPTRLSMPVLAALCDILNCEPGELIQVVVPDDTRARKTGTSPVGAVEHLHPRPIKVVRPK